MRIPETARAVLESNALGHLVTINPDGSPQVSVIWVGLDGDEIIAAHVPNNQKVKNIRRDGRVALTLTYIGPDAEFFPGAEPPPGYLTHITPTKIGGVGPWA
ncbi:pyridoxamine 5'-phosphate oxidase family protein [Kribbella sp. CA-245084]|uniref:pyridoxamine 5'-phosphate oxidase family protein n=1 Tax=Kribbella sp. CA-245084 TaxID=3239940 RepID=UPI003D914E4F